MKKVKIALLGLGNVGRGVYNILIKNKEEIMKRSGYEIEVSKILVRSLDKYRGVEVSNDILTTNFDDIINDDSIKIVVEVMGGIEPAKEYILRAIEKNKHIVTANKMLLATEGKEVFEKADEKKVMFQYEASVAGGIPIINSINENLTANKINELYGIVNGTTNYILSKMELEGLEFDDVLEEAKEKGYAEADPTSDIEGYDAQYKLAILSALSFGTKISVDDVYREGITKIKPIDMKYASDFNMSIKLLAIAKENNGELELRVHPTMIPETHPLANVYDSFNAIFINGNAVGDLMFYGKGAGDMPTGSAVVSDIISILRKNIDTKNENPVVKDNLWNKNVKSIDDVESRYYIRLTVQDKPGVLGQITTIFGSNRVSLKSVIQKGRKHDDTLEVTLVLITHKTKEALINDSIDKLHDLRSIKSVENIIRIEDFS
ncbi:homoserine dehydrogenase [Clostridium celatum]|uniref:Homoserine dehydrogenase n=1 Tax=Clostridium celatum DSM 1785 TaxID=545697 RepID=L1Q3E2_9CLOT|nr:homoserine dehydrogenase [Clostridium celatum]EKY22493.1 homoserine dehydrogenase [Clostridium celatum DSM 1785]MCE9656174.1 homoserine dehydrogenase [Clostridium celatum]MDY3361695.1 homoserine dehydrogenase [Clostridium celatum]